MTVELDDPRREDPGEFDMVFTDEAEIGQNETQDIANDLADKIVDHLKSMSHTDAENKLQPIRAAVLLAQDGTLSVAEPLAQKVAMHLTRFPEFHDLTALFEHERTSMMVQHQIETLRVEQSVPGLEMTSGVYRLILTAPGYHDQFVFLQLSVNGRLFTSQNRQEPIELTFPMQMTLTPRSGRVKIAIEVFSTTPPPTSHQRGFGRLLQGRPAQGRPGDHGQHPARLESGKEEGPHRQGIRCPCRRRRLHRHREPD